jgi:hypothetical protein
MSRMTLVLVLVLGLVACKSAETVDNAAGKAGDKIDQLGDQAVAKAKAMVPDKVKSVANGIDRGLDQLDVDEAAQHLASARDAIAKSGRADEDCSWLQRAAVATPATAELRTLCDREVPLARATRAVVAAEKARADQPGAPSLTECASDDWGAMQRRLDGGSAATDPRWVELKTRWATICPGGR